MQRDRRRGRRRRAAIQNAAGAGRRACLGRAVDHRQADAGRARARRRAAASRCGSRAAVRTWSCVGRRRDVGDRRGAARRTGDPGSARRRRRRSVARSAAEHGSGRPSFFAKYVSRMCLRDRRRVRAVHRRARRRPRRRSPGCRAARRTRTSRCRAGPCGPAARRPRPLIRDDLRGAGLAAHVVAAIWRAAPVPRAVDDQPQAVADRLQLLGVISTVRLRRRRRHRLPARAVVDRLDQVRRDARAAVGERRHIDGQRDRRDRHLPLADRDRDRLAGVPLLVLCSASSTRSTARGPATSLGRSMPDFTPRPSSVAHLWMRSTPSMLPTV